MPIKGSVCLYFVQEVLLVLLFLLLHLTPSLAYSLKNCTITYSADVFVNCADRKLVTVPDDIPRDATITELSSNNLKQISREDFRDMSKLRILILNNNKIAHVDDGSFIHLGALKYLDMSSNQLTILTAKLFQGLSNLNLLDLSSNYVQFIHNSTFQFLPGLHTVKLGDNQLQQITDIQPILQVPHLQVLSLGCSLFSSFDTKDLPLNMSSGLKVLEISGNNLENFSISTPIFPHLETIDISGCNQPLVLKWDIPDKTFLKNITRLIINNAEFPFRNVQKVLMSLDSLMHLTLDYSKLVNKRVLATVCKIPTLRILDLLNNQISNLSVQLVACSQLSELVLSSNYMAEISKSSIQSMKRLRSLDASTNLLTKVPDDVRSLSSLEILDLSDNHISDLSCEDFINTTHLTELYLGLNHISRLDNCVFKNLNDLKILDVRENLLWTFGGAFKLGLHALESLHLGNNFILCYDMGGFQGLESLKYLDLRSDKVSSIKHKAFDGLDNVETLTVSIATELDYNFRELHKLENLTIYFNIGSSFRSPPSNFYESFYHLKYLKFFTVICKGNEFAFPFDLQPQIFEGMRHLEDFTAEGIYSSAPAPDTFRFNFRLRSLSINQADLSNLDPELFLPIPNLQVMDFFKCKIRSLDFLAQADLPALRYLILSSNEISVINETVFQSLPALTYLDLDNNPFICDCSNAGFIQWVKSNNRTQVVNAYQYTCSFPEAEHGQKLLDFDIGSCSMDFGFLCFISSTCLVVLTLVTSFVYHFLRWQLAYTFYLLLAFLYDSRKRKKGAPHQYDAFISYNVHDEPWVHREMLPALEGEQGWRLCLHHRDFQPGKPIIENITDAIYGSRKTICVISRRYLQSEWCSREIQMASFRLFDEQKDVLILLFLEDIPAWQMSPYHRMRKLVKKRTYLSWPQAGGHSGVFWENVRRALETGDAPMENTNLLTGPAEP
ncbi:toll-like receptor 13 [Mastacembelus armatus]|uniref:Toll-like receptor 13 n=1 Tax=Mastacembelus armatus TaxID=205130 RepID=A0A3Q3N8V2_9TELE|nr:toll-like receptor 13 [Mastacembelus armatus]